MSSINKYTISETAITEACHAWQIGGSLALGLWLSKFKPKFNTQDYAAIVGLVRVELSDTTDYSKA